MKKTPSIVDVLIENITTDQALLEEADAKIAQAKGEKAEVVNRLKDYRKEIAVIAKYATDGQKEKIEALGFDTDDNGNAINNVAAIAFDIVVKAKDYKIENGEWYEAYKEICEKKKEEPLSYTFFNIKCRTLFNTQRLIRTKAGDPKSSREDIISLNGRPAPKEDEPKDKTEVKKTATSNPKKNGTASKQK
jgi:hypothetical protein